MCKPKTILASVGLALSLFCFGPTAMAVPQVTGLRIGEYPSKTRMVLDLTSPVKFSTFILGQPFRVIVDMTEVTWSRDIIHPPKRGLLVGMRFGLFKPGYSRIVIDAAGPVRVAKAFMIKPSGKQRLYRLVLDLAKTTRQAFVEDNRRKNFPVSGLVRPSEKAPSLNKPKVNKRTRKVIMIDPGHGGVDPGAISRSGLWEKHIVLSFARELRRQLFLTGKYRVLMTRNVDIFVRLRERIAVARRADADLFISIHADSIKNRKIRGTSVYTLSERASDREADALARKENMSDLIAGVDRKEQSNEVVNILIDLAQRKTMNQSAFFARDLIGELVKVRKMLRNTHRFAGFSVLKAPDIPSVLVELGYLSNREDEKMLRDLRQQRRLATAMTQAIEKYFQRELALDMP
ncbi:MAG: N-acetylmuramoyl-L-alanine amidase [Pseudomonadota bacterium]|nr:N-acetylmuramoyl-L-alanine amidase [Pseudomonadota bacterium]